MVEDVLEALKDSDADKALAVWHQDDKVDELYHELYDRIQDEMQQDPDHIPSYIRILFAAKSFERIGDYVTRLAASVYFIAKGERFEKHIHAGSSAVA
mgnify:CR=1 FL=1